VIARQQGIQDITLVGVEASPERSALMRQHLEFNALRPSGVMAEDAEQGTIKTRLFEGAIWTMDGEIFFPESDVKDMGAAATGDTNPQDYRGQNLKNQAVPCRRLETLLQDCGMIDFMHIDIQGAEFDVIENQIDWICQNVRSLMVATHNRWIEGQLVNLLWNRGWLLHREKPCQVDWAKPGTLTSKTAIDGSQYWLNTTYLG
jgi:FkbM family methyltransferase